MEKTGFKIISGAQTTLAVKGLMMVVIKGAHQSYRGTKTTQEHYADKTFRRLHEDMDFDASLKKVSENDAVVYTEAEKALSGGGRFERLKTGRMVACPSHFKGRLFGFLGEKLTNILRV